MMFRPLLPFAPASGFVAFDGVSPVGYQDESAVEVAEVIERAAEATSAPAADGALRQSPAWQPAIGVQARRVEGAVIFAICGYFLFALVRFASWL